MTRLTKRRLVAIEEALHARLAGAIDHDGPPQHGDYEAALAWVQEQIDARSRPLAK